MTMGISSYGSASALDVILNNNQTQLNKLTQQLSSGNVSSTLTGYGSQAAQVLNLNHSISAANAYVNTTNTVSTYLNGTDDALTQLTSDATQLSQGLSNLTTATETSNLASFTALVNGLQVDATATLNTQVGNRYIFSGSRYDTAPVQSLSGLPALTTPTALTAVTSPTLPPYDGEAGTTTSDASAYAKQTATIAPGETIGFGVTSNDPAIQQLVNALQNAQAAAGASDPLKSQYVAQAQTAVQQAITGLQALQAGNAENISQVTNAQTAQQQSVTTLTNVLGGITNVDTTQVAAQITSLQTQIEASYRVTSSLLSLTLTSYLGATTG